MSLARAFTTRRAKPSLDLKDAAPQRSNSLAQRSNTLSRGHGQTGSIRNKISAPMELTHTTNMLAYNAPDLYPQSAASTSSKGSDDDSDSVQTNASSPPTSPDAASADEESNMPEPNHLSCYFTAPGQKLPPGVTSPGAARPEANGAPAVPLRSPSHTKKASYDNLAQKQLARYSNQSSKSISTKASFTLSRSSSTSTTATSVSTGSYVRSKPMTSSVPPTPTTPAVMSPVRQVSQPRKREVTPVINPFGQELAKVSELAEDFGLQGKLHILDEEEQELVTNGLCKLRPEDYLAEVHGLFSAFFTGEVQPQAQAVWI